MAHKAKIIDDDLAVITVSRELENSDRDTVNRLRDLCREQIDESRNLIIDFSGVNICPSMVWGNLIVLAKRARESGCRITLCCLRPTLEKSVRIIGMGKYVDVCSNVGEAEKTLRPWTKTGDPTLHELLNDLVNGDEIKRRYAAEDLGDLGDSSTVPALAAALRDRAIAVREAAAEALITIGDDAVCQAMLPLLDDDDSAVRNLATEVFERLRAVAIPACIELYSSSSHDLRKIAVDTLGKIEETRKTEGFATLVTALDDPHINVATTACEALGRLGGTEAVEALSGRIGRHPWMDSTIFLSLARIGTSEARAVLQKAKEESLQPEAAHALQAAREIVGH
ncbi:MAG: HEAT repeat domain-containing protein [Deltaproteobacteria bacterium]|nr:HEAT repeat domain-containing protein [Deltaproteobacteria bacterium]